MGSFGSLMHGRFWRRSLNSFLPQERASAPVNPLPMPVVYDVLIFRHSQDHGSMSVLQSRRFHSRAEAEAYAAQQEALGTLKATVNPNCERGAHPLGYTADGLEFCQLCDRRST